MCLPGIQCHYKSDHSQALITYSDAINSVRYVQHDSNSTNELRADLLEVMVTCNNNAATCCIKLKQWNEAKRFATNAMILLDALYNKRGMKIHTILNKDGITDAKLFGEWKGKSLLMIAKSWINQKDYEKAIQVLKEGKKALQPYLQKPNGNSVNKKGMPDFSSSQTALTSMDKEINKLLYISMQKRKEVSVKEKKRARAMFGGANSSSSSTKTEVTTGNDKEPISSSNGLNSSPTRITNTNTNETDVSSNRSRRRPSILKNKTPSPTKTNENDNDDNGNVNSSSHSDRGDRRVSFDETVKTNDFSDEEEEEPWYQEHKEALIVAGVFLAAGATMLLRPKK